MVLTTTTQRFAIQCGRLDAGYLSYCASLTVPIPCEELFLLADNEHLDSEPQLPYRYVEIGDVDSLGRTSPSLISSGEETPPERLKVNERIRKKVAEGKAMPVQEWQVLIPKTRPYLGKFLLVAGPDDNYYTTDFHALAPSTRMTYACGNDSKTAAALLFITAKSLLMPMLVAASRWGKTYPTIHADDLIQMEIEESVVAQCTSKDQIARAAKLRNIVERLHGLEQDYVNLLER